VGDVNQKIFLKKHVPKITGPILEVGSKDYGNTSTFRGMYKDNEYTGIDIEEGENVDRIVDLTRGIGDLQKEHFELIICCSVLEHVNKPWLMAENIISLMAKGGYLYVSVPWVWKYHLYPEDYFRISWKGVEMLFPSLKWGGSYYSTTSKGEFIKIEPKTDCYKTIIQGRKYLPYLMVNMVGQK